MARRKPAQVHGLLVVDKPAGMTSHDVIDKARRILGERKIGHSGTLDPDATGVLLLGVGDATRLLRFLDNVTIDGRVTTSKSYTGTVVLGTETTTLDASGEVTATYDMSAIIDGLTIEKVQAIVDGNVGQQLLGDVMQVPPMVSALKVYGKRLHELAREGIEIEREARPVTVHSFTVVAVRGYEVDIDVTCSSGTYIRTLLPTSEPSWVGEPTSRIFVARQLVASQLLMQSRSMNCNQRILQMILCRICDQ